MRLKNGADLSSGLQYIAFSIKSYLLNQAIQRGLGGFRRQRMLVRM